MTGSCVDTSLQNVNNKYAMFDAGWDGYIKSAGLYGGNCKYCVHRGKGYFRTGKKCGNPDTIYGFASKNSSFT